MMMSRNFKFILSGSFISAIMLIIFLQFNSNRSLSNLISANENLLQVATFGTDLQQLQTDLAALDNKVKGAIIKGIPIDSNHVEQEIKTIYASMDKLQQFEPRLLIAPSLDKLNNLVTKKIDFDISILDTFNLDSKAAAEQLINTSYGLKLNDSIKNASQQIELMHNKSVQVLLKQADSNGRQAGIMGNFMALIAALAALFTLIYVVYKVRQQQVLIRKLDESEKKALEAVRVKENFLANMSHEIRTPLNAILGYTQLLQKKTLDAQQELFVSTIHQSSQNLLTIVNDILDLSKIEAGMLRIEPAPCNLKVLVNNVVNTFRQAALQKNITLTSDVDPALPELLQTDGLRLSQVLTNLVGNSIKFTDEGGVTIKIFSKKKDRNEVEAGIAIIDTGIGISPEDLPHIFDRFQQGERNNTRIYGGTGLGLAIVKDLVHLLNGTITVKSDETKGTEFLIALRLQISTPKEQINIPGHPVEPEPDFNGLTVLVAEDNAINQDLIRHMLNRWKINVHIAGDGVQVLQKLSDKDFDLVLMDIQMPGMDGYSCTEKIRNQLHSRIPIIAMTAHAMPGEKDKCIAAGMNDYLSKPVQEDELRKMIVKFTKQVIKNDAVTGYKHKQDFQTIDIAYLQEVSAGDSNYEKLVTGKFLQMIPSALAVIEQAWQQDDAATIHQVAHNMKTTISIMGLNPKMDEDLTFLEDYLPGNKAFDQHFASVRSMCNAAIEEAQQYYRSI